MGIFFLSVFFLSLTNEKFIVTVISDVHLDPKYDPTVSAEVICQRGGKPDPMYALYGRQGCDSPASLMIATLNKMKEITPSPDLIIVPGDLVGHELIKRSGTFNLLELKTVNNIIAYNAASIADVFPGIPIIFTQGNDDYPINYQVANESMKISYYGSLYEYFIKNITANRIADIQENYRMYMQTGCYFMRLPNGVVAISINSIHFSKRNLESNDKDSPAKVFTWLDDLLAIVEQNKTKAILVFHIPNGVLSTAVGVEIFWVPKHEATFNGILRKYKDSIIGIFTGHIHSSGLNNSYVDSLQMQGRTFYGGVFINRAVSPRYENNPGFTVYQYSDALTPPEYYDEFSFALRDSYNTTDSPEKFWSYLYNSRNDMDIPDLSAKGIQTFLDSLEDDLKKYLRYILYRLGFKPYEFSYLQDLIEAICSEKTTTAADYLMCRDSLSYYFKDK